MDHIFQLPGNIGYSWNVKNATVDMCVCNLDQRYEVLDFSLIFFP